MSDHVEEQLQRLENLRRFLTPMENVAIDLRFGFYCKPCTYKEIGRLLRLSAHRVATVITKALRRLSSPKHKQYLLLEREQI